MHKPHVSPSSVFCLLSTVCCLLLTGCIHRSLTIETDPPGALVYLNDQLKGKSPITQDFMWYGWYRITLRKDGFQRLDDHRLLKSPLYLWIPLDLAMELIPFPIRDNKTWSYVLKPSEALPVPHPPETPGSVVAPESNGKDKASDEPAGARDKSR